MFPDNELSDPALVAGFRFPVKQLTPADMLQDWEMGGIALNDPSQGLEVQLWHFTLVVDQSTGDSDVFVEAPSVPKTLLFSGLNITEIAGCFDQNMNPMVAYQQGGTPKIWWWDPTAVAMVHTNLPAGSIDLRCTMDDKRRFNVAASDIVLSYVRGGALYYRYQRERYLDEHLLFDTGSVERLISLAMNERWRLQWRLRGQSSAETAVSVTEPFLGDIVYDLCRQSGILPQNINVADLYRDTDLVPGLLVNVDDGLDKPIDWLAEIFQFTKSQYNKKLNFEHKGKEVSFRIPYEHLVVTGTDQALRQEQVDEKGLPRKVNINHIDSTGGFARNKQSATRRSNLITTDEQTNIESKVVLTPDQGATAALTIIKAKWGEQYEYEFSTTIRYTEITPGDVGEVEDAKGVWHRIRIRDKNEDDKVIEWDAIQDAGDLTYGAFGAPGSVLRPPVSTTPGQVGDTILEILNLPVQRDQDDELGLYIAARGVSPGWAGYSLYYSVDEGTSYIFAYTAETPSNIGETVTSLTGTDTSVEVLVPYPLESVTADQITLGYNRAVIGDEEIQYRTATLIDMVDGQYHYALDDLERGVLRTLYDSWPSGARFVQLDPTVTFVQIQRELYNKDIWYKAVSVGQSIDEVDPIAFMFDFAFSQTEWAVGNVVIEPNPDPEGTGVMVTWTPAPRLGTFGAAPFESKYFGGYRLKFGDGFIVDVPPGTTSYVYEDAYVAGTEVTVEVWSLNEITGESAWAGGAGAGAGGGGGEEPGGGDTPAPVVKNPFRVPASITVGTNGGFEDPVDLPYDLPASFGTNLIADGSFTSTATRSHWRTKTGAALPSNWDVIGGYMEVEAADGGDYAAYCYDSIYNTPIWPFPRYTFTVSAKVQAPPGVQVAVGLAWNYISQGESSPQYLEVSDFVDYVGEVTLSHAFEKVIDQQIITIDNYYNTVYYVPVVVFRNTTSGVMFLGKFTDVSLVVASTGLPAMTELPLSNRDLSGGATGWQAVPGVVGLFEPVTVSGGYARHTPSDPHANFQFFVNLDGLSNHGTLEVGKRLRITWKSWCDDNFAVRYHTRYGTAAHVTFTIGGAPLAPGGGSYIVTSALMRGDYTEYEAWYELPNFDYVGDDVECFVAIQMKTPPGKESRFGDLRVWMTDDPEP